MRFLNAVARRIIPKSPERYKQLYPNLLKTDKGLLSRIIMKIPDFLITDQLMTIRERINLIGEFEESNKNVAREYLKKSDGKLFSEDFLL